jgi:menaquinone-dependent protoporphyrinogen oxidase
VAGTVLIAYSSKHGSTAEVAEAIGRRLCALERAAQVMSAASVHSVEEYEAVIVGSPIYAGHWQRETMGFLRKHRDALARLPIAVFALGPRGRPGEEEWEKAERQLSSVLRKHPWLRPVSRQVVGGAIDPAKLRFPFSHMPACDWRDWEAIEGWADSLVPLFSGAGSRVAEVA